jgi:hypothetical protein
MVNQESTLIKTDYGFICNPKGIAQRTAGAPRLTPVFESDDPDVCSGEGLQFLVNLSQHPEYRQGDLLIVIPDTYSRTDDIVIDAKDATEFGAECRLVKPSELISSDRVVVWGYVAEIRRKLRM